jgi:transcription elongation factor Elf1
LKCPKCGSENVTLSIQQTEGKMRGHHRGLLWHMGRWFLIICTAGLWLLVGRSKGSGKIKYKNKTMALCQACGHTWKVKN